MDQGNRSLSRAMADPPTCAEALNFLWSCGIIEMDNVHNA